MATYLGQVDIFQALIPQPNELDAAAAGLRTTISKYFWLPGSRCFWAVSIAIVGCRYCVKCQVCPLIGCGLPFIRDEMTPMRHALPSGGVALSAAVVEESA